MRKLCEISRKLFYKISRKIISPKKSMNTMRVTCVKQNNFLWELSISSFILPWLVIRILYITQFSHFPSPLPESFGFVFLRNFAKIAHFFVKHIKVKFCENFLIFLGWPKCEKISANIFYAKWFPYFAGYPILYENRISITLNNLCWGHIKASNSSVKKWHKTTKWFK